MLHIDVSNACNLRCEYCGALSPYRKGVVSKEELLDSLQTWSQKILPQSMSLTGGEPFLHPNCDEIAITVRKLFPKANITIISNGYLIPKLSDDFLKILVEKNITIRISQHIPDSEHQRELKDVCKRLKHFGVKHALYDSASQWVPLYHLDDHGIPLPYKSYPKKAWTKCSSPFNPMIHGHSLFNCCHLSFIHSFIKECKSHPNEWDRALNFKVITSDRSLVEIVNYLRTGPMETCSFCPEKIVTVEPRQIPIDQLHTIHRIITK
jgi:organic radical activating enzyme